ncbi:MAG: GNAT family N-acetyltransferase [Pseudomonadota bacterium]|nr:GNAT family N-acetyltransferase [Pseudomonadota bacterium]
MKNQNEIKIEQAYPEESSRLAPLVIALLNEIMTASGASSFNINLEEMTARCEQFINSGSYIVYKASINNRAVGLITLCESLSLYAEGTYGIIQELYVIGGFRSLGIGKRLVNAVKAYGKHKGWKRLEVTTPPLPEFDRTFSFYEKQGFSVAGGKKMKIPL